MRAVWCAAYRCAWAGEGRATRGESSRLRAPMRTGRYSHDPRRGSTPRTRLARPTPLLRRPARPRYGTVRNISDSSGDARTSCKSVYVDSQRHISLTDCGSAVARNPRASKRVAPARALGVMHERCEEADSRVCTSILQPRRCRQGGVRCELRDRACGRLRPRSERRSGRGRNRSVWVSSRVRTVTTTPLRATRQTPGWREL
jgi:hypothetical protein